jgi:LPXTG-motif cell wall-anchored protein
VRTTMSTLRRVLVAGVLVAAGSLVATVPAHAGTLPTVLGQVACDPTTGEQLITWSYTNAAGEPIDFDIGTATPSLTSGTLVSPVVGMEPASGLVDQATAQGETIASADAVGTVSVSLTWFRTVNQGTITATGSVLLFGDCVVDTTAPVVETTAPPATQAPTTALLGSGGNLPHAGNDDTLLYAAFALVLIGGALLLVRRRAGSAPS